MDSELIRTRRQYREAVEENGRLEARVQSFVVDAQSEQSVLSGEVTLIFWIDVMLFRNSEITTLIRFTWLCRFNDAKKWFSVWSDRRTSWKNWTWSTRRRTTNNNWPSKNSTLKSTSSALTSVSSFSSHYFLLSFTRWFCGCRLQVRAGHTRHSNRSWTSFRSATPTTPTKFNASKVRLAISTTNFRLRRRRARRSWQR